MVDLTHIFPTIASFNMRDEALRANLLLLQEKLIPSIESGTASLKLFQDEWVHLQTSIASLSHNRALSSATAQVAYTVAEMVSIVAGAFVELEDSAEKICDAFAQDLSTILDEIYPAHSDNSPPTVQSAASRSPYIQPAYEWLLRNLHDPYPSGRIRNGLADQSGCHRKDIDGWFTDARKRMGWNALRKSRFSNKRNDIVDAATRFFIKGDPKQPLDPAVELEFVAIESRAKDLYSEKFLESALATKLDTAVKDMTLEMKAQARAEEKQRKRMERRKKEERAREASFYPSPERSPGVSPEPSLPSSEDGDLFGSIDLSLSNHKRRKLLPELTSDDEGEHSRKRGRCDQVLLDKRSR